jgi:hypothetical protein
MATSAGIEPISDPRGHVLDPQVDGIRERTWGLTARVDPTVTFEEYIYWAKIERAEEHEANRLYVEERGPLSFKSVLKGRFSKGIHHENAKKEEKARQDLILHGGLPTSSTHLDEKGNAVVSGDSSSGDMTVSPEEWKTAARALKTASWGTIFFLITTDILGWSSTPYVLNSPP